MRSAGRRRDRSGARGVVFEARRLGFSRAAEGFHGSISLGAATGDASKSCVSSEIVVTAKCFACDDAEWLSRSNRGARRPSFQARGSDSSSFGASLSGPLPAEGKSSSTAEEAARVGQPSRRCLTREPPRGRRNRAARSPPRAAPRGRAVAMGLARVSPAPHAPSNRLVPRLATRAPPTSIAARSTAAFSTTVVAWRFPPILVRKSVSTASIPRELISICSASNARRALFAKRRAPPSSPGVSTDCRRQRSWPRGRRFVNADQRSSNGWVGSRRERPRSGSFKAMACSAVRRNRRRSPNRYRCPRFAP